MAETTTHDEKVKKKSKSKKHSSSRNDTNTSSSSTAAAPGKDATGAGGSGAAGTSTDVTANGSCQHLAAYYKEFGLTSFNVVHAFFSASISPEARRQKVCTYIFEGLLH